MTGVDPTTAPELDAIVWRDRDGDHWRFGGDETAISWRWIGRFQGWGEPDDYDQEWIDEEYGPLVAVGTLPAWTGPGDDVEPDDVPAVTE